MDGSHAPGSPLIVAIDGPSGVGKSTAARRLARLLGVPFLDTGAMYRAIGLKVLENGVDPNDREAVEAVAATCQVSLGRLDDGSFEVLLDGEPVESRIRTPEVGEATSAISAHPEVRRRMVALQREAARHFGGVLEGRDIGTRVFPETPFKFYLDAQPDVRFRRRHDELVAAGRDVTLEQVMEEIRGRDRRDSSRADSPLVRDASHQLIDASDLSVDEVVERMAAAIQSTRAPV
ncbi:MAG TPA: (d)CMP kinase [Thermoanaerobaculia bacterium]|jgi:cytidylate kinase|nr:(d)CMP kinase [Thermoanaerobaculia bacterium]